MPLESGLENNFQHFQILVLTYLTSRNFFGHLLSMIKKASDFVMSWEVMKFIRKKTQNMLVKALSKGPIPDHISFIMDGNRRYARSKTLPLKKGHEAGGLTLLTLVYMCKKIGVKCVSAYAFSIENFKRPAEEVATLMELFDVKLKEFARRAKDFHDPLFGSRLKIVGDMSFLSQELQESIERVEELTKDGDLFTLYICFPYTSRNDICNTMRFLVGSVKDNTLQRDGLSVERFTTSMYLGEFSDKCDILIRTSGNRRLSDYMLWQCHENSTLEFVDTLWPDFTFLNMYLIILKWAFFTIIQRYNERQKHSIVNSILERCRDVPPASGVSLGELPIPPISVTVTGNT